jgi:hypothetical protein
MNYFEHCQPVEEAKKRYRELLIPNHAGPEGKATTKEIIQHFNSFLNVFMSHSFNSYYEDKKWKPGPEAVTPFRDMMYSVRGPTARYRQSWRKILARFAFVASVDIPDSWNSPVVPHNRLYHTWMCS